MTYDLDNAPKSGATKRVWDLADHITGQTGRLAKRKEVIEAIVAEGGNLNTASTQYHHWKTAQKQSSARSENAKQVLPDPLDEGAVFRLQVALDGSVRVPAEIVTALGASKGGALAARVLDGELVLAEPVAALRRVQGYLDPLRAQLAKEGVRLSDELIAERRVEGRSA